jgi:hypothetical protein
MRATGVLFGLALGVGVGAVAAVLYLAQPKPAGAASNDRYEDYVMVTGAVQLTPKMQTDGVWLLDYKSGKLLGTVIDKAQGKIVGWAEVDLVAEYEVAPKQDVHFLMTTGWVSAGQSALYVAETTTGKFGVYTMGPSATGSGVVIRRHDMSSFRQAVKPGPVPGLPAGVGVGAAQPAAGPGAPAAPAVAIPPAVPQAPGGLPGLPPVAAEPGKK